MKSNKKILSVCCKLSAARHTFLIIEMVRGGFELETSDIHNKAQPDTPLLLFCTKKKKKRQKEVVSSHVNITAHNKVSVCLT